MRNRFRGLLLAVVAALAFSSVVFAQTASQSGAATTRTVGPSPGIAGVWVPAREFVRSFNADEVPPMQPWAEKEFNALREGLSDPNARRDDMDPATNCAPLGFPRILMIPLPTEIIQLPGKVLMLFEWDHWIRPIYTDGRDHPKDDDLDPTWMGHAIGRWDGDTLVVDTVGLKGNGVTWIDTVGHPHTEALHIVERWRRIDYDTLQVDFTFDDPKAYTKPWKGQYVFTLKPDWEVVEYVNCEDHLREVHLQKFIKEPR